MKKLLLLLALMAFVACKNDTKQDQTNSDKQEQTIDVNSKDRTAKQSDGLTLLKGEFVYYADAAVLQTHREVYAVIIDEKMHELDNMAKPYKNEATDYVTVEIRGKITPKPANEEGWPHRVAIKEILQVKPSNPESNNVVKLESK